MKELLSSAEIVAPLLLIMAAGYFVKRLKLVSDAFIKMGNALVFKVFLPISLCYSIYATPHDTAFDSAVFWYIPLGIAVCFGILFLVIPRIEKDGRKTGVIIQCIGRSNYALFGIPLVTLLFPDQNVALASMVVVVTVPVYNTLSVIALETYCGGKADFKHVLLGIVKNPLILSSLLGFILWRLNVPVPAFVTATAKSLGSVASPLALFLLGGAITLDSTRAHKKQLLISVIGKLVLCPLVFITGAALLGVRGVAMGCVLISFGAPTAVSSYTMAQQMGGDDDLAAEQVAFTSAFSILSVFLWIFVLRTLSLL